MADGSTTQQPPSSEQQPPSGQPDQPPGGWRQAPPAGQAPGGSGPGGQETTQAWVAYILTWITGLIILLMADKNDKFTRFHAIQAIGFGIVWFVVYIVLSMFTTIMGFSGPGAFAGFGFLYMALWVLGIIGIVLLAVKAHKGEMYELPIIGKFAREKA
jgi:uncharacterized membrane protein